MGYDVPMNLSDIAAKLDDDFFGYTLAPGQVNEARSMLAAALAGKQLSIEALELVADDIDTDWWHVMVGDVLVGHAGAVDTWDARFAGEWAVYPDAIARVEGETPVCAGYSGFAGRDEALQWWVDRLTLLANAYAPIA